MSLTAVLFVAGFAGLLLLALVRDPVFGLYAYVGEFYLHPVDHWWGADLPLIRWSLLAAGVTIVATLRQTDQVDRPSWIGSGGAKILLLFTLWFWLQNGWAYLPDDHLEASILFTKYIVVFALMHRLLYSEERIHQFMVANVAGCLYLGLLVLQAPPGGRLEGVGGAGINEANALGMQLTTGLLMAACLLIRGSWRVRALALAAAPLIANGIVQTQSRGTFLGLLCGGAVILVTMPARYRRYWYVLGIIGLGILIRNAPENYWERISTITNKFNAPEEVDGSAEGRMVLLSAQWRMFQDYPFGVGHRGTAYLSPSYLDQKYLAQAAGGSSEPLSRTSHNTFMSALVEQGLPGAILYLAMVIWIARTALRLRRAELQRLPADQQLLGPAVSGVLASILVAGMFTDYLKAEAYIWSISLLAILADLATQRQSAASPEQVPAGSLPAATN